MPLKKEVTLKTVADHLGLTVHTVSKALRGLPGMSESTRRTVIQTARELGYHTKAQSAGLSAEHIPWVGMGKPMRFAMLIVNDLPLFHMQVEGLHQRLNELGHVLTATMIPGTLKQENDLMDWLERSGLVYADGLFLPPVLPGWIENALLKLPIPKVMINYPPEGVEIDSVIWDVQHAVHLSVKHLFEHGHRRILYVGDVQAQRGFRLRWQSFQTACAKLGIPFDPSEHLTGSTANRTQWLSQLTEKLAAKAYTAAIFTLNADATWLYAALQSLGHIVPRDLSLVGTDHEAHPSYPNITRPVLLVHETAERAAELMLRRIANPHLPYEHVRLIGTFASGDSVATVNS